MKITKLSCDLVDVPFDKPIRTAVHDIRGIGCVLVTLESDQGLAGEGYLFILNGARLAANHEMVESLADFYVGKDPYFAEGHWQAVFQATNFMGHKGPVIAALSALDTACWDLVGKALERPLHRVFGACRDRIPTYASGGLWLSMTPDECAEQAQGYVAQGFTAVKLRIGSKRIEDDVLRARVVRDAIGPDVGLMVDANQSLTVKHAIRLARALEEFDLIWFEEPVPYHDLSGHAEIRSAIPMPLASGETEYTRYGMRDMIQARSADILMPDLQRIGGLTEFRRAGALAAAFDIPVSSHIFTEHSLCVAASLPNCMSVEHMPWTAPILSEPMELEDGCLVVPERHGTGFCFDPAAIERYRIG